MNERLKNILEKDFGWRANRNQLRDLERLIFEIMRREDISQKTILQHLKDNTGLQKHQGRNKFFCLKSALIRRRFPLTSNHQKIDTKRVFLNSVRNPLTDNSEVNRNFAPCEIYVEKEVKKSYLVDNFRHRYPEIPVTIINRISDYRKQNPFKLSELKKPIVFIIKEKWDFIKPCPCTKGHLSCGYWIFNLGFGCPYDCSYCFLQQYTNFPGIILPANIDDFFRTFDRFSQKLKKQIRIGTGEFSDSLALDHVTEYSKKLIPYFENKNVLFELKTKSANVAGLLTLKPAKNCIISWSLNPSWLIESQERGAATLEERLDAARQVQQAGYKIAFHFDPIIHCENWRELYHGLIDRLYHSLKGPFAWISLGTLRCNRTLKTMAELRFPQSNIFYGELLIGSDKKLRYPQCIRSEIYKNMVTWIQSRDNKTPLYLCMENSQNWNAIAEGISEKTIEQQLTTP